MMEMVDGRSPAREGALQVIEDAREHVVTLLQDGGIAPLDAAAWLSAHMAAVEHVVYPAAQRILHDDAAERALNEGAVRIEQVLRLLERRYSGDGTAAHFDARELIGSLVELAAAQTELEQAVLDRLGESFTAADQHDLVEQYRAALVAAPTRPHPHAPHRGRLGAIAFRINAIRDRVMDALDSRTSPVPQVQRTVKSGRWGDYLTGRSAVHLQ